VHTVAAVAVAVPPTEAALTVTAVDPTELAPLDDAVQV
jgi:hypothetical protein